ncbi:MAG: imidazole glycerol phosphate synthase subunit HisH [Melioribacteraceae bacterium]
MIVVIDSCLGNSDSFATLLSGLNIPFLISSRESDICKADKIIFPGEGDALSSLKRLHMMNLFNLLRLIKKPLLGIGLGMQLLSERSKEGESAGLGVFPVSTEKFDENKVTVPHAGLFPVKSLNKSKLFDEIEDNENFYFAHSFYLPLNQLTTSTCNYNVDFSASMEKDIFYGVQFHPQKSGSAGVQLMKNFVVKC